VILDIAFAQFWQRCVKSNQVSLIRALFKRCGIISRIGLMFAQILPFNDQLNIDSAQVPRYLANVTNPSQDPNTLVLPSTFTQMMICK